LGALEYARKLSGAEREGNLAGRSPNQERSQAELSAVAGESAEKRAAKADVAQLAERVLGKDEVTSSILVIGSSLRSQATRRLSQREATAGTPAGDGSADYASGMERPAKRPRNEASLSERRSEVGAER
jgi:hypothetical protein